jgi:16S rRNA (guanine527-N7)-methyltransferase
MIGFLKGNLLPNLRVQNHRAEEVEEPERYDVVTGRAVAPLPIQMEISAAYARLGGYVIPMRTDKELAEIERFPAGSLGLKLEGFEGRELVGSDAKRVFPLFRKVRPTPKKYPRTWAEIKRSPLGA